MNQNGLYTYRIQYTTHGGIDPTLLLGTFSVSDYLDRYVFHRRGLQTTTSKLHELFPLIRLSENFALNNTCRGMAKVCAADDLEFPFFGENSQVDLLENHSANQFQNSYRDEFGLYGEREYSNGPDVFMGGFEPTYGGSYSANNISSSTFEECSPSNLYSSTELQSLMGTIQHSSMARDVYSKQHLPFLQIQSLVFPKMLRVDDFSPDAYFDTTSADAPVPFFPELKLLVISDNFSCGLSVNSFDSPLDEIFVKTSYIEPKNCMVAESISRKRTILHSPAPPFGAEDGDLSCNQQMEKKIKCESQNSCNATFSKQNIKLKEEDDATLFVCPHCDAEFRVRSYLTRHLRKHNNAMAFVCPFFLDCEGEEDYHCGTKSGAKCHSTGGFSRKDTFKTHLKALHFIYPPRTRSRERSTLGGRCAGCFEYFDSNVIWFKDHIEPKLCPGFVDKSFSSAVKQEMEQAEISSDFLLFPHDSSSCKPL